MTPVQKLSHAHTGFYAKVIGELLVVNRSDYGWQVCC